MLAEDLAHGLKVVVGGQQGVGHHGGGHTGGAGDGEGGKAGTGGGQEGVGMAVVAAHELEHLVAAGDAAGQAQGAHGGFGAGVDHAHHFQAGHVGHHFFGQGDFVGAGSAVAGAATGGLTHGGGDGGVIVAQDHGAPGEDEVDVLAAVHVDDVAAVGFGDEKGQAVHVVAGAHGAVDPAGDELAGFVKKRAGFVVHWRQAPKNRSWRFF